MQGENNTKVMIKLQNLVLAYKERSSPESDMEICLFMIDFAVHF
jgi:hypothetical protein